MLGHHFEMIEDFYGDERAERSGVLKIRHIREGLAVLNEMPDIAEVTKAAYCIHPIIQSDADFLAELQNRNLQHARSDVLMLAVEYRSVANSYLSKDYWNFLSDHIARVELVMKLNLNNHVAHMLIADKIQNCKDFERYNQDVENAGTLHHYFRDWLHLLNVEEDDYQRMVEIMDNVT